MRNCCVVLLANWCVIAIRSSFLLICGDFWSDYLPDGHLNFMLLLVMRGFSWRVAGLRIF